MLSTEEIKKIEDFVAKQPRSMQEIAEMLDMSWRTADRYIEQIKTDFGTLQTCVFREGTRGALKIVYKISLQEISATNIQKQLEQEIFLVKNKSDFSVFDIYQHVKEDKKKLTIEEKANENETNLKELEKYIKETQKQLLMFSGNLSWINLKINNKDFIKQIDEKIKEGVKVKVICDVDLSGKENIEALLALNFKYGKELVEIHHKKQPLRAIIFDDKICKLKEVKEPTGKVKELNKRTYLFYTIKDKEWVTWLTKIFSKMFNETINSKKRLEELNKII